jgi:phage baseplate assembly protein W
MSLYRGFSTDNRLRKYRVTDFDLAKQDLFNHFRIRKGEKLMNPEFGTVIWNLLFEPLTGELQELIIEDISKVVKYDPRLAVGNVVLNEYEHGLAVNIELTYLPDDLTDTLYLQFNKNSQSIALGKIK